MTVEQGEFGCSKSPSAKTCQKASQKPVPKGVLKGNGFETLPLVSHA